MSSPDSRDKFQQFLALLDADHDHAVEKYSALRRKLTTFFAWRGCGSDAEDMADDVLLRVVERVDVLRPDDPTPYVFGMATNVARERLIKRHRGVELDDVEPSAFATSAPESASVARRLLEEYLAVLPESDRHLLVSYFTEDRATLAQKLGVSEASLRVRVHRLRRRLEALHRPSGASEARDNE
jgi:RNA polymerase sigma factor (sigma-70 family)